MTLQDPFEAWKEQCRRVEVSPEFGDRVMNSVQSTSPSWRTNRGLASGPRLRPVVVLAFAACVSLVVACQLALVVALVATMSGVAL